MYFSLLTVLTLMALQCHGQENGSFWWLSTTQSSATVVATGNETRIQNSPPNKSQGSSIPTPVQIVAPVPSAILSPTVVPGKIPRPLSGPIPSEPGSSRIPGGPNCLCVAYYLCRHGDIITDGAGLIDIRFGPSPTENVTDRPNTHSQCPNFLDVCCSNPLKQSKDPNPQPVIQDGKHVVTGHIDEHDHHIDDHHIDDHHIDDHHMDDHHIDDHHMDDHHMDEHHMDDHHIDDHDHIDGHDHVDHIEREIYVPGCGRRNEEGVHARITGFKDNQAQFGEFPWMTAILRTELVSEKEVNLYICGGSLIHPQVVLTSAHCVQSKLPSNLKVRLGEWDTQRTYELLPHQDRTVINILIHPEYNSGALFNDFALLFLAKTADLAAHIDTVCLPTPNQRFEGSICYATGWGKDEFGKEGHFQNVLKRIDLPVVSPNDCQNSLRSTRLGQLFQLDKSFICAGGIKGKDTCKGDGGSPLVCRIQTGLYVQAGIVAWGIGCGENGVPGVYANVARAVGWINREVSTNLGLNSPYWMS